jgi:hypothetical protein
MRRFYTLTATCPEARAVEVGPTLRAVIASLKIQLQA